MPFSNDFIIVVLSEMYKSDYMEKQISFHQLVTLHNCILGKALVTDPPSGDPQIKFVL